jgi:uncharacterized protein YlxW (UPF0749 family)
MTRPSGTMSPVVQRVVLGVLAMVVLLEVGCVSRRTYEGVKAETLEQTQALEAVREDLRELDQEIAGLQASNRREDSAVSALRASVQREEEQLPIMRQQAEDTLASLKIQVATLMNQSWHLAQKIVDIRQESASLQTRVAQYKEKIEQVQFSTLAASDVSRPSVAQTAVIEPPPSTVPISPSTAPPQMAQTNPTPPPPVKPATPSPAVKVDPPSTNDSWIGMIVNWLSAFWKWLIS